MTNKMDWKPDDWDTRSIVKEVLLSISDSPREQTSSDMLVEAGADTMHRVVVKWLQDRKVLINLVDEGRANITFNFTVEEWLAFTGRDIV